jgi:hypothetical protein
LALIENCCAMSLFVAPSTIAGSRPAHEAQPMPLRKKTA